MTTIALPASLVQVFEDANGGILLYDRRNLQHCLLPAKDDDGINDITAVLADDHDGWLVDWLPGKPTDSYPADTPDPKRPVLIAAANDDAIILYPKRMGTGGRRYFRCWQE